MKLGTIRLRSSIWFTIFLTIKEIFLVTNRFNRVSAGTRFHCLRVVCSCVFCDDVRIMTIYRLGFSRFEQKTHFYHLLNINLHNFVFYWFHYDKLNVPMQFSVGYLAWRKKFPFTNFSLLTLTNRSTREININQRVHCTFAKSCLLAARPMLQRRRPMLRYSRSRRRVIHSNGHVQKVTTIHQRNHWAVTTSTFY